MMKPVTRGTVTLRTSEATHTRPTRVARRPRPQARRRHRSEGLTETATRGPPPDPGAGARGDLGGGPCGGFLGRRRRGRPRRSLGPPTLSTLPAHVRMIPVTRAG